MEASFPLNSIVLKTVLAVGGLTWVLILVVSGTVHVDSGVQAGGLVPASRALWAPYGGAVTAASLFVWLFDRWLWAWPPFAWFVERPNLRGTWRGELQSQWVDPKTQTNPPPIPAFMIVTQTSSTLYLRQFTGESESSTIAASVLKDHDDAESVAVLYRNDPKVTVRDRSPIHFGGLHLRVSGRDAMEGDYWTDRNTTGRLTLKRISQKKSRSFAEAQELASRAKP
jgi:hypothetical protein